MQSGNLCYGWPSVDKAAEEIYCGLHSSLLSGYPLFLYKELNTTKSSLVQVVVVKNLGEDVSDYGVGITGKLNRVDKNNPFGEDNIVFISIYDQ